MTEPVKQGLEGLVREWRISSQFRADEIEPFMEQLKTLAAEEPHAEDCHQLLHCTLTTCDCWKAKLRKILNGEGE